MMFQEHYLRFSLEHYVHFILVSPVSTHSLWFHLVSVPLYVCRIQQLEGEVSTHQQRVAQLQVEKEKALADLIAIRKLNRSMEK